MHPNRVSGVGKPPNNMPQTHLSLHYHIIFSTKERRPIIADEWKSRLYAYLGGCVKTAGGAGSHRGNERPRSFVDWFESDALRRGRDARH